MKIFPLQILLLALAAPLRGADTSTAANAINALGIDLLEPAPYANSLFSPYSLQEMLAMAYAGSAGKTHEEMAKALHFPKDGEELNQSFAALEKEIAAIEKSTRQIVSGSKEGGPNEPVTLVAANRVYAQAGFDFRKEFLTMAKEDYGASLEQIDFQSNSEVARRRINAWVSNQTHGRVPSLLTYYTSSPTTRLLVVNAVFLRAAWADEFQKNATQPAAFNGSSTAVEMMHRQANYGYAKKAGYTAVALPFVGSELQFLVLLPDDTDGLHALEQQLTPALLAGCATLEPAEVDLWLPKFKVNRGPMQLKGILGMRTAFNDPEGSADFDGIAPRTPDKYLYISEILHQTFLSVDEHGAEATAATAPVMATGGKTTIANKPVEVHVDHPFVFAIQDCKSGACLFIGYFNGRAY